MSITITLSPRRAVAHGIEQSHQGPLHPDTFAHIEHLWPGQRKFEFVRGRRSVTLTDTAMRAWRRATELLAC
ncbi:MAG: hypothetical protein ACPG4T_19825 [Nannocystaceae bacterium]